MTAHSESIYAIGDIHGNFDKLESLLEIIGDDFQAQFVFIGDYIDRGPKSKEVIDLLIEFSKNHKAIFLKGNHEAMLLEAENKNSREFSQSKDPFMLWLMNGGDETCKSYGGFKNIFVTHGHFLKSLHNYYETDHYIFVHAGLKPGKPLSKQSEEDLLWIRDQFIIHPTDYYPEKIIIYGHTITNLCVSPYPDKIGIDTGAGWGGQLTAVKLPHQQFIRI